MPYNPATQYSVITSWRYPFVLTRCQLVYNPFLYAVLMSIWPMINMLRFKRDLRLRDHAPLKAAIASGQRTPKQPLLLLYCFEPSLITNPNYDQRQWRFVHESLTDLKQQLGDLLLLLSRKLASWCISGCRLHLTMRRRIARPKRVHPRCGFFIGK